MKTAFAKSPHRSPFYTKFATPLVLDSPRHCGFGTILLSRGKHLLGTSHDCSVQLRAGDVQPRHAMIVVGEHRTVVKALDPRTWVNDGPVSEMALRPGDRLSIGPLTFRVRAADADELAAIEAADEQTCTGDFSFEVTTDTEQSTTAASSFEAVPVGTTTVSRVAVPSAPADVLATPVEFPIVAEVAAVTPPVAMSRVAQQPAPVEPTTPVVDMPTGKVIRPDQESTAESTSSATLDFKLDEIQRTLSELQQPIERRSAALITDGVARTDALASERRQFTMRQDELQQRADELARQSQQLHERVARVVEREIEVERSIARLTLEHEQLGATAEVTRKELDDEYARHMTLWQEWDAAYRRTTGELNGQLQSMELRRTALLTEADRLASERSELQRLQAEYECDRRFHATERVQLTTDRAALQSLRAEFGTERQQHLVAVQEREARVAAERRAMSTAQEELIATRQQLERERSEFLDMRSTEALRREQELREYVEQREQLERDHARIQARQLELNELRHVLEAERAAFDSQWETFIEQQSDISADRAELARLRDRLQIAEAALLPLQQAREASATATVAATNDAADQQSSLLDWIVEPYKTIQTPPPVPADWRKEPSIEGRLIETTAVSAGGAAVASSHADILPLPRTIFTSPNISATTTSPGGDSHPSTADSIHVRTEATRGDRDNSGGDPAARVMAPAASGHRFWEDNTLYDTSVGRAPQPQIPMRSSASSNLMMADSGASPDAVSSGEDRVRPLAGSGLDEFSENGSVTVWSRSLDAVSLDLAAELEYLDSTATATADIPLTADETFAEINRNFGVRVSEQPVTSTQNTVAALPSWWIESNAAINTIAAGHPAATANAGTSGMTIESLASTANQTANEMNRTASERHTSLPAATVSADPLSSVRAELARMFELPTRETTERDESSEPAEVAENSEVAVGNSAGIVGNDEESLSDNDYMELTLTHISSDVANDAQPKIVSVCEPEPTTTPQSLDETVGSSDSALAAESASPEIVAETESTGEDEDSIEACMAKLLSRTRGTDVSENDVKSLTAKAALVAARSQQSDSSNSESSMPATPFDPADRSHLTAEPKHKQDRLAAREDLQSFRQVAHQSARSALARHTTKHLLSAFVAKAMLLGVSVMATTAFLGAPLVGMPTQIWKALACAIAMMLSATEVYRSWRQLRCWKAGGAVTRKEAALPTSAATLSVEIATMTESEPPVATNE